MCLFVVVWQQISSNAIDCIIFQFLFEMSLQMSYFVHSHFVLCLNKNFSRHNIFSVERYS